MKIGISGTRGIPNNYGGFEQFAQYLSLGLLKRGHEVWVYNSNQHPYKEKEWKGVLIIYCRDWEHKIGTWGQFFYDLNCINDARKRNFDILLHLGYTSDSIWHWRWPKKTINIVNMDGLEWKRSKYSKATQRFLRWAESLAAKNAQILVADSPGIQEHLLTTYGKLAEYIPYGAKVFTDFDPTILAKYKLLPHQYFLLIARMEPENNIEMIIQGWLAANHSFPLFIIGNITNKSGKYITANYNHPNIKFSIPIYDHQELDNLRYYSTLYFHGHSVGGTNPSLLEAMACGCSIAAHNNIFNRAVLQNESFYFSTADELSRIISASKDALLIDQRKKINTEKIRTVYNQEKIIEAYEKIMLDACK